MPTVERSKRWTNYNVNSNTGNGTLAKATQEGADRLARQIVDLLYDNRVVCAYCGKPFVAIGVPEGMYLECRGCKCTSRTFTVLSDLMAWVMRREPGASGMPSAKAEALDLGEPYWARSVWQEDTDKEPPKSKRRPPPLEISGKKASITLKGKGE